MPKMPTAKYEASQIKAKINKLQKDSIGKVMKDMGVAKKGLEKAKKAGESTDKVEEEIKGLEAQKEKFMAEKDELDKEAKRVEALALEKEVVLNRKVNMVGNYVHDSVPVSNTEVCVVESPTKRETLVRI
jgi:seryl-tRNA synthetase